MSTATIGMFQGLLVTEHSIAPGDFVVELKQCENCSATFVRKIGCGGVKFCGRCRGNMLLPDRNEEYREQLYSGARQKHSNYLPKYDDSLLPKEEKKKRRPRLSWETRILNFIETGEDNV